MLPRFSGEEEAVGLLCACRPGDLDRSGAVDNPDRATRDLSGRALKLLGKQQGWQGAGSHHRARVYLSLKPTEKQARSQEMAKEQDRTSFVPLGPPTPEAIYPLHSSAA